MRSFEISAACEVTDRKLQTGDKTWFQRKPGRRYRVRPPVEGEIDPHRLPSLPPHAMLAVAVMKVAPKVRHRVVGQISKGPYPHSEADARQIFEAMAADMASRNPVSAMRLADGIEVATRMLAEG